MERNFAQELKAIMSSDIPADQMREALEHYHKSDIADAIQALSKEERELQPVVVDSRGQIIWLPGLKKSNLDKANNEKYDIILWYN